MTKKKDTIKTMADLARQVGLSRYTVSKVLNNDPTVKEESKNKVLEACRKFNYFPNPHAVNLVKGKTNLIGMITSEIVDPFYGELIHIIENEANRNGFQLLLQCSYQDQKKEAMILNSFRSLNICGLIIAPVVTTPNPDLLDELEEMIPVVYIDRYLKTNCHYAMNDNVDSAGKITTHLISRGTHPAYLGSVHSKQNVAILHREKGYLQTMKKHKLEPIIIPLKSSEEKIDSEKYGFDNLKSWLKKGNQCSSLFCAMDNLALGAMKALYEAGLEPGKDVLVAGHDDLHLSAFTHPPLTTVRQPKQEIGLTAVEVIVNQEKGKLKKGHYIRKSFLSELIIRESA